jgi:hypothetical protein
MGKSFVFTENNCFFDRLSLKRRQEITLPFILNGKEFSYYTIEESQKDIGG